MTEPLTDVGNAVLIDREGMRTTAYYDSVGILTICVGHTSAAGPPTVTPGMTMTEEECSDLFAHDVLAYAKTVDDVITKPMLDHERDAFASICYNIGGGGFASSTFAKKFNANDKAGCAEAILWWDQPSEIIPRRKAEQQQFLTPYDVALPKGRSTDAQPIPPPEGWGEQAEPPPLGGPWPPAPAGPCPLPGRPGRPGKPEPEPPPEPDPPAVQAMERWEVSALQARLAAMGFVQVGAADGIWGPKTTEGVAAFQKHVGIAVDYGRVTAAALADEANKVKPPKYIP